MIDRNVDTMELRLVQAAVAGDRDARRTLFEEHREAAYQVAYRIAGRYEDALDVVQDSFIRAFERLADFQHGSGFKTWLLRIVSNRALDVLRARKVRRAISLDGDEERGPAPVARDGSNESGGVATQLERRESADRVRRALDTLPPDQRAVFVLYASGDMTYGQIAAALGVPIGTVMSRLYHARRRLRELLPDLEP